MMTPEEKSLRGRAGACASWAATPDRSARTAPARKAAQERFERQILDEDPDVTEPELSRRAEHARRAHMLKLSLKSAVSRRKAREHAAAAEAAEAELAEEGGAA